MKKAKVKRSKKLFSCFTFCLLLWLIDKHSEIVHFKYFDRNCKAYANNQTKRSYFFVDRIATYYCIAFLWFLLIWIMNFVWMSKKMFTNTNTVCQKGFSISLFMFWKKVSNDQIVNSYCMSLFAIRIPFEAESEKIVWCECVRVSEYLTIFYYFFLLFYFISLIQIFSRSVIVFFVWLKLITYSYL